MSGFIVKKGVIVIIGSLMFLSAVFMFLYTILRQQEPLYNIIIISIDTLRADHLGTYGYERNTSPNLDRFASESIVFEQAIAQAAFTLPSIASTFTSQYPSVHGVLDTSFILPSSKITLAEVLKEQGYETAAFVGDGELQPVFGINQGFDRYIDQGGISFKETIPLAIKWIREQKDEKFFLVLQGFDVHGPYHKPEPFEHMFDEDYEGVLADHKQFWFDYGDKKPRAIIHRIKKIDGKPFLVLEDKTIPLTDRDIDHIVAHYDGGIRYTDNLIESFFDTLKEMNLYDNSIIIVLAGHGESLGDMLPRSHPSSDGLNFIGHGQMYDEIVRVPLLIKHPALQAQRISTQVQLIDLFPTILDFLNISQDSTLQEEIQGESLVLLLEGKKGESESDYAYGEGEKGGLRFIRTDNWKLIVRGENVFELYDLQKDPRELQSVFDGYPEIAQDLRDRLMERYYKNLKRRSEP